MHVQSSIDQLVEINTLPSFMKSFRTNKMASLIRSITSDMIANKVHDPRIGKFVSVTKVEVAADMQLAKVYISVMGTEEEQRSTMRGLKSAQGLIQRAVAKGVTARICPHLTFVSDHSIKKAAEIMEIINNNAAEMGPPQDDPTDSLDPTDVEDDVAENMIADTDENSDNEPSKPNPDEGVRP